MGEHDGLVINNPHLSGERSGGSLFAGVDPPAEYAEVLTIEDDVELLERAFPLLEDPGHAHGRGGGGSGSKRHDLGERHWMKFPRTVMRQSFPAVH